MPSTSQASPPPASQDTPSVGNPEDLSTPLLDDQGDEEERREALPHHSSLPEWQEQVTTRSLVAGGVIGAIFCIIVHKLALTVGIIPSLNIAAGLLGYSVIKSWAGMASYFGLTTKEFTPQENTVIQNTVVSCMGMALVGGFSNYMIGMDHQSYEILGDMKGNRPEDVFEPSLRIILPYTLLIALPGVFLLLPIRRMLIVDYALVYPSATAIGILINSLHTSKGAAQAAAQVLHMGRWFGVSFLWSAVKWLTNLDGSNCSVENAGKYMSSHVGFLNIAFTLVGSGMLCPHIVNWSMAAGAVVGGLMWQFIGAREGIWYPAGLGKASVSGIYGYKVFMAIAIFMGDGLYNLLKISYMSAKSMLDDRQRRLEAFSLPVTEAQPRPDSEGEALPGDVADSAPEGADLADEAAVKKLRLTVFDGDGIPSWLGPVGYLLLAALGTAFIPVIYPAVTRLMLVGAYLLSVLLSITNAYGCGLTDWNNAGLYGKLAIFLFAAWAGAEGGVISGLAICGVVLAATSNSCDMISDFRTGFLSLSSPRAMLVSQLAGCLMGCIAGPLTFYIFWTAFDVGKPGSQYPAPYATVFRAMAVVGTEGLGSLPSHCLQLCIGAFIIAFCINGLRDLVPHRFSQFLPIPMAMAIPFYIGAFVAIDMCLGSIIVLIWQAYWPGSLDAFMPVIASGLIAGDGIFTVPSAILAVAGVEPPVCIFAGNTTLSRV